MKNVSMVIGIVTNEIPIVLTTTDPITQNTNKMALKNIAVQRLCKLGYSLPNVLFPEDERTKGGGGHEEDWDYPWRAERVKLHCNAITLTLLTSRKFLMQDAFAPLVPMLTYYHWHVLYTIM